MAFEDDEESVSASAPIELISFTLPTTSYHYTSHDSDFVFLGDTYEAVPIQRGSIEVTVAEEASELIINMPASLDVVGQHVFGIQPKEFFCRVRRYQQVSGQNVIFWEGNVTSIKVVGRRAEMRIPSLTSEALATQVPSVYFQTECNHTLYDTRCRKLRTDFDTATNVTSATALTVTVTSTGSFPLVGGEIERTADGERRTIMAVSSTTLTLNAPFPPQTLPWAVTLFAGCDHTVKMCRDTFDNVDNFGGHPFIPLSYLTKTLLLERTKF